MLKYTLLAALALPGSALAHAAHHTHHHADDSFAVTVLVIAVAAAIAGVVTELIRRKWL